jgi:hypothetical protein
MSLQAPEPVSLEVSDGPAPLRPPPEAALVEAGKLTMGQLAQAHGDRLETGKQVLDIIVERGWVPAEEVAQLREAYGIEAPGPVAPAVQAVPEPVQAAPEPPPETEAPPPAATLQRYKIAIRLKNSDLITAGETDGADKAAALGHAVVADLTQENGEWPFFGGRFINPETIVSVDLLSENPDD